MKILQLTLILIVSLSSIHITMAASGSMTPRNDTSEKSTIENRDTRENKDSKKQTEVKKNIEKTVDTPSVDTNTTNNNDERRDERKTEKNAQKIILEVYKIQGNKILKDMDTSIERVNPDPQVRIEVYTSIQKTLELRKNKLEQSDLSTESKDILIGYIDYMIVSIEKRKKNLE